MKKNLQMSLGFALALIVFLLPVKNVHAQWNNNTYENTLVSGVNVSVILTAATTDGKVWSAFYSQNGSGYSMYAQLIDANGNKLLGADGILVSNQPTGTATYVFNICVDASNNLIIACQDQRTGTMQAVVYKISQAGTHLWSPDGVILGAGLAPYPAVLTSGEVIVAWAATTGSTLNLQKITTNGTLAWAIAKAVLVGTTKTNRGQIVATSNNNFTMVFQKKGVGNGSTLYVNRYDSSGTALYTALQISTLYSAQSTYYSILTDGDTTYFGFYAASGSRFNSVLQRINPDCTIPWGITGSNFCTAITSADPYQMVTNIGKAPGSDYIWAVSSFCSTNQANYGVYIQKFLKTTGARQFTDAAKNVFPISSSRDQQAGRLVVVNDTPMFMEYTDINYLIYATRLDANGNFAWPYSRVEISSTTTTAGNAKGRYGFENVGALRCAGFWTEDRGTGIRMGYAQGISVNGVIGIKVKTQGNVPAVISTLAGSLQLVDTVYPAIVNQAAHWFIVSGTGSATISGTGLVTAVTDGTVWAKATAEADGTIMDSLMITISGQNPIGCNPPSGVTSSQVLSSTALIYWNDVNIPPEGYQYEIRTSGEPGSGASGLEFSGSVPAGTDSLILTGLTPATSYYAYLRAVCGSGFYSLWTAAHYFRTMDLNLWVTGTVSETQSNCYNATQTITVAGGDSIFTVMSGGSATFIAGQNILFLPGTTVFSGGYMHGNITDSSQYCPNLPVTIVGAQLKNGDQSLRTVSGSQQKIVIYPNPVQDIFTVESSGNEAILITGIEIFSMSGMKVYSKVFEGISKQSVSTDQLKSGIYFVRISVTTGNEIFKLIKM
ncbi:MAG: T9SS type A sorting domain-containing protein [Bacteroidetes bacterium]|nr:T9SS type A sorting domain-containing protein [Bacteroidota bacterium]